MPRKKTVNRLTRNARRKCSPHFAFPVPFSQVGVDSSSEARVGVPNSLLSGAESNHESWAHPGRELRKSDL